MTAVKIGEAIARCRKALVAVMLGLGAAVANGLIVGRAALLVSAVAAGLIGAGVYTVRNDP